MQTMINIIIIMLFAVYLFWTWNNTKSFQGIFTRISYVIIGTAFITFVTYIIFLISKKGIIYPYNDMAELIRNIIMLIFVPVNGLITLPQIGNTIEKIKNDTITPEKLKKRIIIIIIIVIIIIIYECSYFKSIQSKIIRLINLK